MSGLALWPGYFGGSLAVSRRCSSGPRWLVRQRRQTRPGDSASVTRLVMRVVSQPTDAAVRGVLAGVDGRGQPVADLTARGLQTTLDGQPITVQFAAERPSIAIAIGLLLDSSANTTVRTALGTAIASGLQDLDTRRDAVAIGTTTEQRGWEQSVFTNSADDLRRSLSSLVQNPPIDDVLSLDQVAGLERALAGQSQDLKVLLLITNRTPASAATPASNMAVLRAMAIDDHLQISVLALPQAGGQGVAEALAEATPGGGVEYVLNATNQADLTQRVSSLLAPTGARGSLAGGAWRGHAYVECERDPDCRHAHRRRSRSPFAPSVSTRSKRTVRWGRIGQYAENETFLRSIGQVLQAVGSRCSVPDEWLRRRRPASLARSCLRAA